MKFSLSKDEVDGDSQPPPEPKYFEEPEEDDGAYLVKNDMVGQVSLASYGTLSTQEDPGVFDLKRKLELAQMSEILFNKYGR